MPSNLALADIDLNLLVVLDVLLDERHVTRTAKRLHRTQSAISHALSRLRDQLGDPILVRVGGRMQPTPRAERLAPEVKRLLGAIARVLASEQGWDPATSDRTFTIAGPDVLAAALPRLLPRLGDDAQSVQVELAAPSPSMLRDVADGRFDLAVAPLRDALPEGLLVEPLATMPWAVFARRAHPAAATWGLDAWLTHPHVRVRTAGSAVGPVDRAVAAAGVVRRPGPTLPHFMLAPPLLARSDMLLTVPYGVLADVAAGFGLAAQPCPIDLPPIEMALYRSARLERDPATTWFFERARAALVETFDRRLEDAAR